jgi:hypothetical protein
MARRYVRDNRGRFAPKGSGATARGGRLKTASGKKRETQTMKTSGGGVSGTIGKPKGLKPGAIKPKPQVSSARQAASDRLKIKTATRRKLKNDRASVIPKQSAGSRTMKAGRVGSTVSKPRTKGNAPAQVASRVKRKNAANEAGLRQMSRYGNIPNPSTYNRAIKRANTLKRADAYLKTGKLPGKDNSIRAQRKFKAAKQRLDAKRAARRAPGTRRAVGKISEAKAGRIVERIDAQRGRMALPGRRNANFLRTMERRSEFILKPAAAARKKGKEISVNESVQKAVLNAAKRAKRRRR